MPDMMSCPKCGQSVSTTAKFCGVCGRPSQGAARPVGATALPTPSITPQPIPPRFSSPATPVLAPYPGAVTATSPPSPVAAPAGYATAGRPIGKIRSVWKTFVLIIVTLGIYGLYWWYKNYSEMSAYSGHGVTGGIGLLLGIFGGPTNAFMMPTEIGHLFASEGMAPPVTTSTGFWFLLPLIGGLIWIVKVQGALNQYWRAHGAV